MNLIKWITKQFSRKPLLAQPAVSKCGGDCRKLLIDFHKWQQSMWTSPNAEITENVVDVFLKRRDSVCEPKGRSLKGWPYYGNSKSDD